MNGQFQYFMFKKIKSFVNRENKPGTPLWKALILERRVPWRYDTKWDKWRYNIKWDKLVLRYYLKKTIKNKKVLIIGSGPSASDLTDISSDIVVLTCNHSLSILKKLNKKEIDLHLTYYQYFKENKNNLKLLNGFKIKKLVIDRVTSNLFKFSEKILIDNCRSNYFLKKIIKSKKFRKQIEKLNHNYVVGNKMAVPWNSTGMRLLQYAIFFKAKEIYLAGIDSDNSGHYYDKKKEKRAHLEIDHLFIKTVIKKNHNIYLASSTSPLKKYLKFKKVG